MTLRHETEIQDTTGERITTARARALLAGASLDDAGRSVAEHAASHRRDGWSTSWADLLAAAPALASDLIAARETIDTLTRDLAEARATLDAVTALVDGGDVVDRVRELVAAEQRPDAVERAGYV